MGMFGRKDEFYVVNKDVQNHLNINLNTKIVELEV
jgi:hypothetical protein